MSDRLSGNDLIMRSLHALDFDGERTPPAEVSRRIDTAIAGAKIPEPADPERLAGQVEAFDRSAAAANALPPIDDDIDDQGGDTGDAGGSGNELVSSFLEQLLADDDDRS
jgi:hypothetical protein